MNTIVRRLPYLKEKTGLCRSSIYLRIKEGKFPPPISLGGRAVGWIDAEIEAWVAAQIEKSRADRGRVAPVPEIRQ